jgi:hypothetical protein
MRNNPIFVQKWTGKKILAVKLAFEPRKLQITICLFPESLPLKKIFVSNK